MRKITVTGRDITATTCVEITEEMARAIEKRPTQLKNLLKDLHVANGTVCTDKQNKNPVFEISVCIENVFVLQGEMARFERIEHLFIQQVTKWVEEDAQKKVPETGKYVCLRKVEQGYEVEGNMPLEEVVQTLAQMFIEYAANKK